MSAQQPTPPPGPPAEPVRYWTTPRTVLALVLAVLAAATLGYGLAHLGTDRVGPAVNPGVSAPRAGDCVTQKQVPSGQGTARVVECGTGDAQFTVVRTFAGSTDRNRCADVPDTEFALLQRPTPTGPLNVLCVQTLHGVPRWPSE